MLDVHYDVGIEQNVTEMCESGNPTYSNILAMAEASGKMCPRHTSQETRPMLDIHYDGGIRQNMLEMYDLGNPTHARYPLRLGHQVKYARDV